MGRAGNGEGDGEGGFEMSDTVKKSRQWVEGYFTGWQHGLISAHDAVEVSKFKILNLAQEIQRLTEIDDGKELEKEIERFLSDRVGETEK